MDPEHRSPPNDFITMKRLEFDKMLEQSPNVPQTIANLFNSKFNKISFHKPDIVNGIQTINSFKKKSPKMYYLKKINLYEKMLLLKYFSGWKTYCEEKNVIRQNNTLIKVANLTTSMREREKAFSHLYAPLSTQKKMLRFQNIKLSLNPIQVSSNLI
jgi:hypothetical protein